MAAAIYSTFILTVLSVGDRDRAGTEELDKKILRLGIAFSLYTGRPFRLTSPVCLGRDIDILRRFSF